MEAFFQWYLSTLSICLMSVHAGFTGMPSIDQFFEWDKIAACREIDDETPKRLDDALNVRITVKTVDNLTDIAKKAIADHSRDCERMHAFQGLFDNSQRVIHNELARMCKSDFNHSVLSLMKEMKPILRTLRSSK